MTFERRSLEGVLIVGSDGLLAHVADAEVAEAARRTENVDEIAEELLRSSKLPNGTFPDDVSIVVVRWLRDDQSDARHPVGRRHR